MLGVPLPLVSHQIPPAFTVTDPTSRKAELSPLLPCDHRLSGMLVAARASRLVPGLKRFKPALGKYVDRAKVALFMQRSNNKTKT